MQQRKIQTAKGKKTEKQRAKEPTVHIGLSRIFICKNSLTLGAKQKSEANAHRLFSVASQQYFVDSINTFALTLFWENVRALFGITLNPGNVYQISYDHMQTYVIISGVPCSMITPLVSQAAKGTT